MASEPLKEDVLEAGYVWFCWQEVAVPPLYLRFDSRGTRVVSDEYYDARFGIFNMHRSDRARTRSIFIENPTQAMFAWHQFALGLAVTVFALSVTG